MNKLHPSRRRFWILLTMVALFIGGGRLMYLFTGSNRCGSSDIAIHDTYIEMKHPPCNHGHDWDGFFEELEEELEGVGEELEAVGEELEAVGEELEAVHQEDAAYSEETQEPLESTLNLEEEPAPEQSVPRIE